MGDLKITWTPSGVNAPQLLGLFAYNNASSLPGITSLTISAAHSNQGWDFEACPDLVTLNFPSLVTLTGNGQLTLTDSPNCTTLLLPLLQSVDTGNLFIQNNGLTALALTALVTTNSSFTLRNNAALVSFSAPSWLPTNNINITFSGNALDAASVNGVLARCVANAGYVSGIVDLSGGTSAAPTGAGITDKATLIGRGVTVTTN